MLKRNRVAIIPARGGSKRLPRKNVIDFCGKPLIAWTIEAAIASNLFDRVLVSTENDEIAEVARTHGCEIPFLRSSHFDDHSNVSDVTVHALEQLAAICGEQFETVVMLQPTCPLRNSIDLINAVNAFDREGRDFQISCCKLMGHGWLAFELDSAGNPKWLHPEMVGKRTQDQPTLFDVSGAICVAKAGPFLEHKSFYGPGLQFEALSWMSAIDIDDETDLRLARARSIRYGSRRRPPTRPAAYNSSRPSAGYICRKGLSWRPRPT